MAAHRLGALLHQGEQLGHRLRLGEEVAQRHPRRTDIVEDLRANVGAGQAPEHFDEVAHGAIAAMILVIGNAGSDQAVEALDVVPSRQSRDRSAATCANRGSVACAVNEVLPSQVRVKAACGLSQEKRVTTDTIPTCASTSCELAKSGQCSVKEVPKCTEARSWTCSIFGSRRTGSMPKTMSWLMPQAWIVVLPWLPSSANAMASSDCRALPWAPRVGPT